MKHVAIVLGTRPEAIKVAPLVQLLRTDPWKSHARVTLVSTGQHRELLRGALDAFDLRADVDLDLMTHAQKPGELTGRILQRLGHLFAELSPDIVVAQGDTTTVLAAAMGAFLAKIPFAHVEAGLRSGSLEEPFPEEMHRRAAAVCTKWHFAPTQASKQNLLREGFSESDIFVVGNTSIDALRSVLARPARTGSDLLSGIDSSRRLVLVTVHRRESFGESIRAIFRSLRSLAERFPDVVFVYPMHPNPAVREVAIEMLRGVEQIRLVDALAYETFVHLQARAHLILTDSGGVQEEAPSLGVPTLVLRNTTERPEAVKSGVAALVGMDEQTITTTAAALLSDPRRHAQMAKKVSVYGDGRASERIASVLLHGRMSPDEFAPPHLEEAR